MKNKLDNLEQLYIAQSNLQWRKQLGQVFTPPAIARLMVNWIQAGVPSGKILDPAMGLGIFFREMLPANAKYTFVGYEVDANIASLTLDAFNQSGHHITCHVEDFLLAQDVELFDGVVCNPPYIHFQDYKLSLALIQEFNQLYGVELNGFSNIYALFLVKALHLLKPGGRAAFIIPSEFLNSDYGINIKDFLLKERALSKLLIFDSEVQVFQGILTTSAILLFERKKPEFTSSLEMLTIQQYSDLSAVEEYLRGDKVGVKLAIRSYTYEELKPEVKWRHYYSDLKINLHLHDKKHLVPFAQFANTRRGIATGANDFFTFSAEDLERLKIDRKYVTPCLSRASQAQYPIFSELEFQELVQGEKNVFLLNVNEQELDEDVLAYIRYGEEQEYHKGYLTRNRQPWYSTEPLRPADLLIKTFGRKGAVFIENRTKALHLTCFHGIYFNPLGLEYREALVLYLLTDLAREIFEGQKREYGSGLGKFEPNDIKHAKVLDVTRLSTEHLAELGVLYQQFSLIYRSGGNALAELLRLVEDIFYQYW